MRVCRLCGIEQSLSNYYPRNDSSKYRSECKKCHADKQRKYNLSWAISRRHQRKKEMVEKLGIKCFSCHNIFPVAVYDFHHIDPSTKEHSPTRYLLGSLESREKILRNCALLCANCHRIEHAQYKLIPKEWLNE